MVSLFKERLRYSTKEIQLRRLLQEESVTKSVRKLQGRSRNEESRTRQIRQYQGLHQTEIDHATVHGLNSIRTIYASSRTSEV